MHRGLIAWKLFSTRRIKQTLRYDLKRPVSSIYWHDNLFYANAFTMPARELQDVKVALEIDWKSPVIINTFSSSAVQTKKIWKHDGESIIKQTWSPEVTFLFSHYSKQIKIPRVSERCGPFHSIFLLSCKVSLLYVPEW